MKTYTTTYKGFKLIRNMDTGSYKVRTPSGELWQEVAVNMNTAKKWVRCSLALYGKSA